MLLLFLSSLIWDLRSQISDLVGNSTPHTQVNFLDVIRFIRLARDADPIRRLDGPYLSHTSRVYPLVCFLVVVAWVAQVRVPGEDEALWCEALGFQTEGVGVSHVVKASVGVHRAAVAEHAGIGGGSFVV